MTIGKLHIADATGVDPIVPGGGGRAGAEPVTLQNAQLRRLYLRIEGVNKDFWQNDGSNTTPDNYTRDGHPILEVADEASMDLDLGEMKAGMSAMTFYLNDFEDTDGKSWFGKATAPAKWTTGTHQYLEAGDGPREQLAADATTINLGSSAGFDAGGDTVYIGAETCTYTGITDNALTGVTKGLYPAVTAAYSSEWGGTYERPEESGGGYHMHVSTTPFSWVGRRVALYGAYYDKWADEYSGEANDTLIWVGRISDRLTFEGKLGRWVLSCKGIYDDLKKKIAVDLPTDRLAGINLCGDNGRTFWVEEIKHTDTASIKTAYIYITVDQKWYSSPAQLRAEITDKLQADWVGVLGNDDDHVTNVEFTKMEETGKSAFYASSKIHEDRGFIADALTRTIVIHPWNLSNSDESFGYCHALQALGFGMGSSYTIEVKANSGGTVEADGMPYEDYTPLDRDYNYGRIYVEKQEAFWEDQGDYSTPGANIKIAKANLDGFGKEGTYFAKYTSAQQGADIGGISIPIGMLVLDDANTVYKDAGVDTRGFAGRRSGEEPIEVQQVCIPNGEVIFIPLAGAAALRGPFTILLHFLTSTGTLDYNQIYHASLDDYVSYDKYPLTLAGSIQADLIDADSFFEADQAIMTSELAHRVMYVIDQPTTLEELLSRECKLFGYALCWRNGKLTIVDVASPNYCQQTVTISDSTRARPDEWPNSEQSTETVVNQYEAEIEYDATYNKWGRKVVITDVDSVVGLQTAKAVSIKHPGIYRNYASGLAAKSMLDRLLKGRFLRQPLPVVRVTLAPSLANKVFVGDTVRFQGTDVMDPLGSGDLDTDVLSTVLNVTWSYGKVLWTGEATLLLHAMAADIGKPWGGSALIDREMGTGDFIGGWDGVAAQLKVKTDEFSASHDPDDGAAFSTGDYVKIVEVSAWDPSAPLVWDSLQVTAAYASSGAQIITLDSSTTLTGWPADAGEREFVLVHDDFGAVSARQKEQGTWLADDATRQLDGTTSPYRYA